jgi:hypothetical protein
MSSVSCTSRPNCLRAGLLQGAQIEGQRRSFTHALRLDRQHLSMTGGAHALGGLLRHGLLQAAAGIVGAAFGRNPD